MATQARVLPRRRPFRFARNRRRVPRRWRAGLHQHPKVRRQIGVRTVWAKVRQILFWWWAWGAAAIIALIYDNWGWAIGTGLMAIFTFLAWPSEVPPRVGLDHEFCVEDEEFLTTMAGATGVPFFEGNRIEILNNGDSFYPAMLRDIARREIFGHDRGLHLLGRRNRTEVRARARREIEVRRERQDSARCGRLIVDRRRNSGDPRQGKMSARVVQPRASLHTRPFQSPHTSQVAHSSMAASRSRAAPESPITGWATHRTAQHWRDIQIRLEGPAVVPLQTGFAQNWLQATSELITGFEFYPPIDKPAGTLAVQTILSSPETGASTARTFYYLSIAAARRTIYIANPYFVPDQGAIDLLIAAKRRGVDVRIMVAGIHNDNWMARQNSVRLYGPFLEAGHSNPRIQPHDASSEDDGRRRRVVDGRDDELRQPFVRAQRREQRLLLR